MIFLKTLLARLREFILVARAPGFINLFSFERIVTQSSNFMITFFIQPPKAAGKNEFLKIFTNYWLQDHSRFIDDGTFYTINQKRYFVLNTQSFILSDQGAKGVVEALSHNFGIHASIQKASSYYKLYIRSKYTKRFVDLIRPYLQTCFAYKIQGPLSFSWADPAKRSRLLAHPERGSSRRRHLRCKWRCLPRALTLRLRNRRPFGWNRRYQIFKRVIQMQQSKQHITRRKNHWALLRYEREPLSPAGVRRTPKIKLLHDIGWSGPPPRDNNVDLIYPTTAPLEGDYIAGLTDGGAEGVFVFI